MVQQPGVHLEKDSQSEASASVSEACARPLALSVVQLLAEQWSNPLDRQLFEHTRLLCVQAASQRLLAAASPDSGSELVSLPEWSRSAGEPELTAVLALLAILQCKIIRDATEVSSGSVH